MHYRSLKNCIALLSLCIFLLVAAGNVYSYAWCIGDEHSRIERLTPAGCADNEAECTGEDVAGWAALAKGKHAHDNPCLDVQLSQGHAVFSKRTAKLVKVDFEAQIAPLLSVSHVKSVQQSRLFVLPPRESQTILALRTVVLRN